MTRKIMTRNVNVLLRYLPFLSLLFQCTNSASWIITNFYSFISLGTRKYDEERPRDKKEKCSRSRHGRILANSATSGEFLQRSTVSYRPLRTRTRIFLDKIFLTGRARSYLSEGRRPLADTSQRTPFILLSFPDIAILISSSARSRDILPDTRTSRRDSIIALRPNPLNALSEPLPR